MNVNNFGKTLYWKSGTLPHFDLLSRRGFLENALVEPHTLTSAFWCLKALRCFPSLPIPDADELWRNNSSLSLLETVKKKLEQELLKEESSVSSPVHEMISLKEVNVDSNEFLLPNGTVDWLALTRERLVGGTNESNSF